MWQKTANIDGELKSFDAMLTKNLVTSLDRRSSLRPVYFNINFLIQKGHEMDGQNCGRRKTRVYDYIVSGRFECRPSSHVCARETPIHRRQKYEKSAHDASTKARFFDQGGMVSV
jgi:TolB-like protein